MDYDENTLGSEPTMVPGGARRSAEPYDEPSLGSAPTMRGRATPPFERLRSGDSLLGRYTVLSELGEGGMGVVYKCLDTVGGIEVAVKCLPPELGRNETEMEGIRENYAIVSRLHHSAISGLRQLEKDPRLGEYYLVMDLARGEDLSAILRRRRGAPMPPDEALAILRPIASALDYAHGEKVLHRDVKPGNVKVEALPVEAPRPLTKEEVRSTKDEGGDEPTLVTRPPLFVTPKYRVQLLDFGLAAEVRSSMSRVSLRGHAGSSGTPAYMAPEQWEARRQSAATDQYSLAAMAYQMLSGSLPFDADDQDLLRRAVLSRPPDPVPGLPRAANAALLRALSKDPNARFPSCTAFVEALARGFAGKRRSLRPWLLAGAAAVVVLGVWLWRTGGTSGTGATGDESVPSVTQVTSTPPQVPPDPPVAPDQLSGGPTAVSAATSDSRDEPATSPSLPPDGATLDDLQAARACFSEALEARRADNWPDSSAESTSLATGLATLDVRISAALKMREEEERKNERERVARRAADAKTVAEIGRLKAAADREAQGVAKYRKWDDGEFKTQFATLDSQKAILDGLSVAADIGRAKEAAADIHASAVWIADNAEAREGLDAIEKAIDDLSGDLDKAEARRYAQSALYGAKTARDEAVRCRDKSDFVGARIKFEEAKRLTETALADSHKAQTAAKAALAVGEAEAAKIREDWEGVIDKADEALRHEPANAAAKRLKEEAEEGVAAEPVAEVASVDAENTAVADNGGEAGDDDRAAFISEVATLERVRREALEKHGKSSLENARKEMKEGNYAEAQRLYEEAVKFITKRPGNEESIDEAEEGVSESIYRQAVVLWEKEVLEEALQLARKARERNHPKASQLISDIQNQIANPPKPPRPKAVRKDERKVTVALSEVVHPPIIIRNIFNTTRNPGMRGQLLAAGGGNAMTEASVMRALRWLKAVQNPDGSWPNNKVAMTGLAILTFLAHGEKPGDSPEFGEAVQRAIEFLICEQENTGGGLFSKEGNGYAHAIATCAICEAYGMTMNPNVKIAADAALEVIINGQHPSGGWDYNWKQSERDDTSVMGWAAQALKAGMMANFYHDPEALERASRLCVNGFKKNGFKDGGFGYTRPAKGGLTGVGTLCMQFHHAANDPYVKNSLQNIIYGWKPEWIGYTPGRAAKGEKLDKTKDLPPGAVGGACPQYYSYYGTQAVFQGGGEQWKKWNDCMWPSYVAAQFKINKNEPGSKCNCGQGLCSRLKVPYVDAKGEYQEIGHWVNTDTHTDRPVMDTCLAALQLMVYYRYLPTFN